MTISEDLLLLATDPETGKCRLNSMISDVVLGGAILVDLLQADRVEVKGQKSKARVT
ncbi:MAG: GPP34 family phosphoprotein, partial [Aeromicrobium sp.]